ncbi:hypothetical protein [uncultured Pontibacter sp.]|uniref:hypothetical protein n=1 Tax=uncultured Pontibacter sp. TaxID=453356 RepID=UPI002628765E|nr:hypothetical protein [uncultured Pontibacter sp.]
MATVQGEAKFGESFLLEKDGAIKVTGDGETLLLQFNAVTDSRCPKEAVCIWLGNATVLLSAANAAERIENIAMCIGDCRPDPVRIKHTLPLKIGEQQYSITLKEVLPHPGLENAAEKQMLRLVVEVLP